MKSFILYSTLIVSIVLFVYLLYKSIGNDNDWGIDDNNYDYYYH